MGGEDRYEFASYNIELTPYTILAYNYVFGISENGLYLVGTNIGQQSVLYNLLEQKSVQLTYNRLLA